MTEHEKDMIDVTTVNLELRGESGALRWIKEVVMLNGEAIGVMHWLAFEDAEHDECEAGAMVVGPLDLVGMEYRNREWNEEWHPIKTAEEAADLLFNIVMTPYTYLTRDPRTESVLDGLTKAAGGLSNSLYGPVDGGAARDNTDPRETT